MTDPTAAEAVADAMKPNTGRTDVARRICDTLGIDPDSPLSLLHWHAVQAERERIAELEELLRYTIGTGITPRYNKPGWEHGYDQEGLNTDPLPEKFWPILDRLAADRRSDRL